VSNRNLDVVVTGVRQVAPRIREYLLTSADRTPLPRSSPGAHVELHLPASYLGPIVRHYSLIGGFGLRDDPPHTYRIAVQREQRQRGSAYIHDTFDVGTPVRISHPLNNFPLSRTEGKSLLIAGGIGITPILSMLRSLVRRKRDFAIVYSGRTSELLAYHDDVLELAGARGQVHLSGEPPLEHLNMPALLAAQPLDTITYVCGPAGMIEATNNAAKAVGLHPDSIRSELFASGPHEDDVAFDVELSSSGRRIRVGRETTILDALTAAGVDVLSDCRRGECGLCPLQVVATDSEIDHRDRYLSGDERASGKTLCICVSRIKGERLVLEA
jgi:ferredoxin-NADP reductase